MTAVGDCRGSADLNLIGINVLLLSFVGANVLGFDNVVHDVAPIRRPGYAGALQAELLSS